MENKHTKEELEEQIGWMRLSHNEIMDLQDPEKRSSYLKKYRHFMHQMSPLFTKLSITDEEAINHELSFGEDVKAVDIFHKMYQIKCEKDNSKNKTK